MMLPNNAVVAVADGGKLLLFRNHGTDQAVKLMAEPDPVFDATNTGSGSRHHSSSANPDSSRLGEDDFSASVAGYLNNQALNGKLDSVVIVADPRTLGELRVHFHKALEAKIIGQVAKDLTGQSIDQIEATLAKA